MNFCNAVKSKRSKGRPLWLFLGVCLVLAVVGCGDDDGGLPVTKPFTSSENVLRYDVNAPFASLDPTTVEHSGSTVVFPLLYSHLFFLDSNGKLIPDLAEKWSYDAQTFTWAIQIRNDAFFHNQKKITAKDVIYSLKNYIDNINPALKPLIEGFVLKSDTILIIRLKQNDPDFLKKILGVAIVPDLHKTQGGFHHKPVGSGPFMFALRDKENKIILDSNPLYYKGRPQLERVVFYFEQDKEKSWVRLLAGKTDIAQEISPKNYQIMQELQDRFRFDSYALQHYAILLFNSTDPLFNDLRVRKALSMAINREYIVQHILRGFAIVANGPMGVGSPFHQPEVRQVKYDAHKALHLLKQAGWRYDSKRSVLTRQGRPFTFTLLLFQESQIEKKVARYIQMALNELGVRAILKAEPYQRAFTSYYRRRNFQVVLAELQGIYSSIEILQLLWGMDSSRSGAAGGFNDYEVSQIIDKLLKADNPTDQKQMLLQVEQRLVDLHPGVFLFHKTALDAMSKRFSLQHPFSLLYRGIYNLKDASLK